MAVCGGRDGVTHFGIEFPDPMFLYYFLTGLDAHLLLMYRVFHDELVKFRVHILNVSWSKICPLDHFELSEFIALIELSANVAICETERVEF
jgi:hypothetical protein